MKSTNLMLFAAGLLGAWTGATAAQSVAPGSGKAPEPLFQLPASASPASPQVLFLAVDERAFPLRHNLALFLTKPNVLKKPVLVPTPSPTAPDNSAAHFNGTVIHENGKFRMWYYAVGKVLDKDGADTGEFGISPPCYAESNDGINWVKPALRQVKWRGTLENNGIALFDDPTEGSNGAHVIRDDEDPNPGRRYKMVFGFQDRVLKMSRVGTAISADGVHWKRLPVDASGKNFAEVASFYKHGGLYFVNSHIRGWGEGDRPEGRQGYVWISTDFEHWLPEPAPSFKVPEPVENSGYGTHGLPPANYTQDHLGVGAATYGNVAIGLWGMWNNRIPNWGEGGIDCHLGLLISQDGIHFEEVVKGLPYIRSDESPADPVPGKNYPTILHQSNSIFNVGDETWIYHGRWRNVSFQKLRETGIQFQHVASEYWGAVALAKLPRDRWGALSLAGKNPWSGIKMTGAVWTAPVTLPAGANVLLTLNGSDLGGLRVEVADEKFQPLPGFDQGSTPAGNKDALDARVNWPGRQLRELGGRTVRIRVHFTRSDSANPRLYALNLLPSR